MLTATETVVRQFKTEADTTQIPLTKLAANPFIGPNPLLKLQTNPPVDNTPPVSIAEGTYSSTGSFLFDTGAAASFISQAEANAVHVHYKAGTYGTDNPVLVEVWRVPVQSQPGVSPSK